MSIMYTVEYDKFITLDGLDLCHYMEPLVINTATTVSKDTLQRMLSELPTYDEYHLVYALELGAKHSPETFAMQLPLYLAHKEGSVWSAVLRSLDGLPGKYVTRALVNSVHSVSSSYPGKTWITEIFGRLEERLSDREATSGGKEKGTSLP